MAAIVVVDANVLIGQLDSRDPHHERASALIANQIRKGSRFAASTLTLAEILVGPSRNGLLPQATAALTKLGIDEIALGAGAAERLAEIRAGSGCRLPDCCVLLAAEEVNNSQLATFDDRLRRAAGGMGLRLATEPEPR